MLITVLCNGIFAIIAGILIGLERQWRRKLAGIRTTALVCLGSSMFVMLSGFLVDDKSPSRIAAQVVSGIGFLAGGVIVREGFTIKGLNTAATLWCGAAVGSIIGAGFYEAGFLCALFITLVNIVLRTFSYKLDTINNAEDATLSYCYITLLFEIKQKEVVKTSVFRILQNQQIVVEKIKLKNDKGSLMRMILSVDSYQQDLSKIQRCIKKIAAEVDIREIEYMTM